MDGINTKTRFAALAALWASLAAPAWADGPVVVELFTSQGCAACPPADALMGELAGRDDVIALSLHVDYWDYIGWTDTFAQPAFSARQHGYGHAAGSSVVYTPQIVIGGVDYIGGYRPMEVADYIRMHSDLPDPVALDVTAETGGWQVVAAWVGEGAAPAMVVQVVTYQPASEVDIAHGENAGHTMHYFNVVTSWQVVAEWSGAAEFQARVEPVEDVPHVVIVQAEGHGAVLGAARLD